MTKNSEISEAILNIASFVLRGAYRREEYHRVILPFTVLKRLDCALEYSKLAVINAYESNDTQVNSIGDILMKTSVDENNTPLGFYNYSHYTFEKLLQDPKHIGENLKSYINCFSDNIKEIFENFDIDNQIDRLEHTNMLHILIKQFNSVDLSLMNVSNQEIGQIFENVIHKLSKESHGGIGPYYTPIDVSKLLASLIFAEEKFSTKTTSIYDATAGTGGLLRSCKNYIIETSPDTNVELYGQEINPLTLSICKSIMLLTGVNPDNIKGPSSTLSDDQLQSHHFDYIVSEPPFGLNWSIDEDSIKKEAKKGFEGRFGAGLPRKNDSQLLFIQHMISKMNSDRKSKIAVITTDSPLLVGNAESGESNIRKWIIENDYLETLIALPQKLFFESNITIGTYVWILTNEKSKKRQGKIQLIDAREEFTELNKKIGDKKYITSNKSIKNIIREYKNFKETSKCKIYDNEDFGYTKITVEHPLQRSYQITDEKLENLNSLPIFRKLAERDNKLLDEKIAEENEEDKGEKKQKEIKKALAIIGDEAYSEREIFESKIKETLKPFELPPSFVRRMIKYFSYPDESADFETNNNGNVIADFQLRETKKIPLKQDIEEYFKTKVLNNNPNAWINHSRTKIGYEIKFKPSMYDEKIYFKEVEFPIRDLDEFITLNELETIDETYDLILKIAPHINKLVYYPYELSDEEIRNQETIYGCNIKSDQISKEYLYYYLNSKKSLKFLSDFQLSRYKHTLDEISFIKIPVPNIKTQNEIAETCMLMDEFFNEMDLWKTNYYNNILNYKPTRESYNEFSCSINFGDDGRVKEFCHNWRIVYQGLIWPLAYTYLKATRGSKDESTMKNNILILFEFLAAFNVIILISGINNSKIADEDYQEIKKELWKLNKENEKTWHRMHFGGWTTLYSRLRKIYKKYDFETPIKQDILKDLSSKKNEKLFQKLRAKERNAAAHGGLEDDIDVETKLEDLKNYINTDIFKILNIYSGLKLYRTEGDSNIVSPNLIEYQVMSLNGPCDPPNWHKLRCSEKLDPYSLYLYDSTTDSFLKIDNDLIRFGLIPGTKQYGIYIYDGVNSQKNVAVYKCYHQKDAFFEATLDTEEETFDKVSENFLKEVLKL